MLLLHKSTGTHVSACFRKNEVGSGVLHGDVVRESLRTRFIEVFLLQKTATWIATYQVSLLKA